jgi:gas vesicle protein
MGQTADELRRDIEDTRTDLGNTLDAIGDRISPSRMVERRKNRMARGVGRLRDQVMGTEAALVDRASSATSSAADMARQAPDEIRDRTQGNPLMAGALAFGTGFLVATVLPVSRKERELGGELRDKAQPVVDELTTAGRETVEHVKEPARQAMEEVKSAATESADELKSSAQQTAQQVTETARDKGGS